MNQGLIFYSEEMKNVYELAKQYASYSTTILIEGETGVGKEIIANVIHRHSPRSNMPFIKVNCAAIPESLLDSELFGYEGGAFTGANAKGSIGIFESAHKGSLLLDEVGELSLMLQTKLLRVLQEREIRKVGGSWSKPIDVRIIACTNIDMINSVENNEFRKDLFYRLSVASIKIPPLHERKADILPMVEYFLQEYCNKYNINREFDESALRIIYNHNFPGNVRELKNIVESSFITAKDKTITTNDLPKYIFDGQPPENKKLNGNKNMLSLPEQLDEYEKKILSDILPYTDSIRAASRVLGISNATLLRRIEKYSLEGLVKRTGI